MTGTLQVPKSSFRTWPRAAALAFVLTLLSGTLSQSAQAQTYTVIHSFSGTPDAATPYAGLILDSAGNLYGTTYAGGTLGRGAVFKIDKSGNEIVLYSFSGPDGAQPYGGLVRDSAGNLYGTTSTGGVFLYYGTVFKLDTTGKETVLHNFGTLPDAEFPRASLTLDSSGNLYGTTPVAGPADYGVVFKIGTSGKETFLHAFGVYPYSDGTLPEGALIRDAAGNLYGTCSSGGAGSGTVFKIDKTGKFTVLYTFTGEPDGVDPYSGLVRDGAGNLYGTTYSGGTLNLGTVFKVDSAGNETVLHSFAGHPADGANPLASLTTDPAGNLYGTTYLGGAAGYGTVFKLDPLGNETVLYSFTGGTDGGNPYAGLVRDPIGHLYGTTQLGGAYGFGVVFKITP